MQMAGTMTAAQIVAMWRNDARALRSKANTSATVHKLMRARADQLEQCAEELSLHLHTGGDADDARTARRMARLPERLAAVESANEASRSAR